MDMAQGAALVAALAGERQHNRLLRLSFPREDGPPAVMLVNSLRASEGLSRDFVFDVEVLSDDASIPLNDVMGRMVTIAMVRDDGALRYFNGYVFEFGFDRTDGGMAFYRMQLRPWLAFLTLRQDCATFQHMNVLELCEKTFKAYPQQDYDYRLMGALPEITLAVQYNESDHNHMHRRLEDAGLYYWYEHRADGHTLWISDDSTVAMDIDGGDPVIEYRAESGAGEGDGISAWRASRAAASMRAAVSSFNFKHAKAGRSEHMSSDEQGMVPELEVYENTGAYGFADTAAGDALAKRRTQELGVDANVFVAGGNHRGLQPGRCFSVGGHFADDAAGQEYLITSVTHDATNNYQDGKGAGSSYQNSLTCIRRDQPWRARRGSTSTHTRIYGVQTATVVGPPGDEIHTDSYGRVRVQFHWDRVGKFDAASSPWVRVMTSWAGTNFGQISLPRIGQEVVVQFLEGNPDRPLIVGSLYNATHMPPWELPSQRALSGIRSRELGKSDQSGHLIFDDTKAGIQTQISSDHLNSQLSLGAIVRVPDTRGREDVRGEGFELRSDGPGVLRTGQGLLITSDARSAAVAHTKDIGEAIARLTNANQLQSSLAKMAERQIAQVAGEDQQQVAADLKANTSRIRGNQDQQGPGKFPELGFPDVVISSAGSTCIASSDAVQIGTGAHMAVSASEHISFATSKSFFASVAEKVAIFSQRLGIKLIAASGKICIQAQSDELQLLAQRVLDVVSTTDWINIKAKQGVRIHGGGSEIEIGPAGIKAFAAGKFQAHAELHEFLDAAPRTAEFPGFSACESESKGASDTGRATLPLR